jgi:hypothetical protein
MQRQKNRISVPNHQHEKKTHIVVLFVIMIRSSRQELANYFYSHTQMIYDNDYRAKIIIRVSNEWT